MTPNYVDSNPTGIVVSPWCNCRGSGNQEEECEKFLRDFTENPCLRKSGKTFSVPFCPFCSLASLHFCHLGGNLELPCSFSSHLFGMANDTYRASHRGLKFAVSGLPEPTIRVPKPVGSQDRMIFVGCSDSISQFPLETVFS